MAKWKSVGAALALLWSLASLSFAEPQVSSKHIFVLYPGVDSVFGSYIFMVQNAGAQPERLSFPVMLPTEVIDFQAQEGLNPNELKLGPNGGLIIDKEFPPGDSLVTIGFKTGSNLDDATLTFKAPAAFESIGFFVFEGKFQLLTAPDIHLDIRRGVQFSGRNYDTYTLTNGQAGQTYQLQVHGIPEGRGRLWVIGWVAGGTLLVLALWLAWRSRPKIDQEADVAL